MTLVVAAVVVAGSGVMTVLGFPPVYPVFAAAGAVLAVSLASRRRAQAEAKTG
jgi:hypothetical protein